MLHRSITNFIRERQTVSGFTRVLRKTTRSIERKLNRGQWWFLEFFLGSHLNFVSKISTILVYSFLNNFD